MKRRWMACMMALVLTAALLCGCSSASGSTAAADTAASETTTDSGTGGYGQNGVSQIAPQESGATDDAGDRLQNAKMIYTASLDLETTAFDDAVAGLRWLVDGMGGYFEQAAVYNYGSGYRSGSYTIRVPSEQFQNLLIQVGELCHVIRQEEGQQDVSEAYYDTESRLVTQQTKLERLQTLLAQAESMEDIITIESAISETELEIEQLTGTLRNYDSLVDFATVYLSLEEVYKLSNTEEPATGFASRMGTAFVSGWKNFVTGVEGLLVALAYGWMWLVFLAVIIVAVVWGLRRRKKRLTNGGLGWRGQPPAGKNPDDKPPEI